MKQHTSGLLEQNSSHIFSTGDGAANICTVSSPRASDLVEYSRLEFGDPDFEEAIANAKRIVACWNACAGIPNEFLERVDLADLLLERHPSLTGALAGAKQ